MALALHASPPGLCSACILTPLQPVLRYRCQRALPNRPPTVAAPTCSSPSSKCSLPSFSALSAPFVSLFTMVFVGYQFHWAVIHQPHNSPRQEYNSVVFLHPPRCVTITTLSFRTFLSPPQETPYPLAVIPIFPDAPIPWQPSVSLSHNRICLFQILHRNGLIQLIVVCDWFLPLSITFFFSFLFFFHLLSFLGPYLWHMEGPRLGVYSELQPSAYTTATSMPDPSHICNLHHSSRQHRVLNLLSEARGPQPHGS